MGEKKAMKKISIGYEDFKELIHKDGYFVDKSLMIRQLLDFNSKVTLFTRPRRFGKTLNLSMIRRFFEDERLADGTPIDNRELFDGLAISRCGEEYLKHQQQYPVISLSLKEAQREEFSSSLLKLKTELREEFRRHKYVLKTGKLDADQETLFQKILDGTAEVDEYSGSLKFLSACLEKYHERKCVILIDEYDVPLENAYFKGYYGEMISFIRSLFSSALKTNDSLELGVITGCLRISRESIFTGLNNLRINSVLGGSFGDAFGFTEEEVSAMADYYGLQEKMSEIKRWYDGYNIGDKEIYNPWSIINYVDDMRNGDIIYPKAYWANTSSNNIVKELVEEADWEARGEIERLIAGEALEKPIHEEITYGDIHESQDNLWNFLYFTGYLTSGGKDFKDRKTYVRMVIPNEEIRTIFEDTVLRWFDRKIKNDDLKPLIRAMEDGDCETMGEIISGQLMDTISFFDYGESYYHGFLTGLLKAGGGYLVQSNRESGEGRTDIVTKTPNIRRGRAFIFEIKVAEDFSKMEDKCRQALEQIEDKKYEEGLRGEGYSDIQKYGICFLKKECVVMKTQN